MEMFFASVLVMGFVVAGMAIGVMCGREPIKGSCGGIGAAGVDSSCTLCGGSPARCEAQREQPAVSGAKGRFYEVSDRD